MVVGIGHGAGQVVVEDLHGVGEIDAVLTPVDLALGLVPVELHVHSTECMYKRQTLPATGEDRRRKNFRGLTSR